MSLWKKITHPYLKWRYFQRAKKPYLYQYKEVEITIFPKVFSPKGTITTEVFADYILSLEWQGKKALELGAGSGIISFLLANRGASVTASDISDEAVRGLTENNKSQDNKITVVHSDMFQNLENQYDLIIVNPPFFAKTPLNMTEKAWFCGENFEYFQLLFSQFNAREMNEKMIMVLSENAAIDKIMLIAEDNNCTSKLVETLKGSGEVQKVFEIAAGEII